jgi:predicted RNase H-like HicB family nuclease
MSEQAVLDPSYNSTPILRPGPKPHQRTVPKPGTEEYAPNVYRCQVYILREDDGRYSAIAATLPGVASYGASEQEALRHIEEAFGAAIETYKEGDGKIPWLSAPEEPPPDSETRWITVYA